MKINGLNLFLLVGLAFAVFSSCSPSANVINGETSYIQNKYWKLKTLIGTNLPSNSQGIVPNLEFNLTNVSGNTACNIMNTTYTSSGPGKIKLGNIAITRRACMSEAANNFDNSYLDALGKINGWKIENGELHLMQDKSSKIVYYEQK